MSHPSTRNPIPASMPRSFNLCMAYSLAFLLLLAAVAANCQTDDRSAAFSAVSAASIIAEPTPTLQAHVEEVPLILTITDRRGKYVQGLSASDLVILDNNKAQKDLTFFQHETGLPLDIAVVIDVSSSVEYKFGAEQDTIKSFLRTVVRPADTVRVFAFNDQVRLVAEGINNWNQISAKVKKLKQGGDTAVYDAVSVAAESLERDSRAARKLIILVSDGEDNHSAQTKGFSIANALRAEAAIYAVNVNPPIWDDQRQGESILKQLADATGGNYFRAGVEDDVSRAFAKIRRELRSQYALAYRPSNLNESRFHRIEVTARRKLHVRCRSGYYVR